MYKKSPQLEGYITNYIRLYLYQKQNDALAMHHMMHGSRRFVSLGSPIGIASELFWNGDGANAKVTTRKNPIGAATNPNTP